MIIENTGVEELDVLFLDLIAGDVKDYETMIQDDLREKHGLEYSDITDLESRPLRISDHTSMITIRYAFKVKEKKTT